MPYPYPIDLSINEQFIRMDSPRNVGPFEHGGALYVFAYCDPFVSQAFVRCYKSEDAGVTWAAAGSASEPDVYWVDNDAYNLATFRDGSEVVVAFPIEDGSDYRLSFAVFDMATDTWSARNESGPAMLEPQSNWGFAALSIGYFNIRVVRRSTGELIFLVDDDDDDAFTGFDTDYYRRLSLWSYSGSWSHIAVPFMPLIGFSYRDWFPGSLTVASDDTVYVVAGSVTWAGFTNPGEYIPDGDPSEFSAHFLELSAGNTLGTPEDISFDLDQTNNFNVLGESLLSGSTIYVPYRKDDLTLAVASRATSGGPWSEAVVATLNGSDYAMLNAVLVATSPLQLVFVDSVGGERRLYKSSLSGTWGTPELIESLGAAGDTSVDDLSGGALSGAVGLLFFYGEENVDYPLSYYQFASAGGGGPRARYYGV